MNMNKCKNCGKELELVVGKRVKLYCGDACRMAFRRKNRDKAVLMDNLDKQTPSAECSRTDELLAGNTEHAPKSEQIITEQPYPNTTPNNVIPCNTVTPEPIKLKLKDGKLYVNRKPSGKVTQAEIDNLPEPVRKDIHRLCTGRPDEDKLARSNQSISEQDLTACQHVRQCRPGNTINIGAYKSASELGGNEFNRVSLPGDSDYSGVCNAQT